MIFWALVKRKFDGFKYVLSINWHLSDDREPIYPISFCAPRVPTFGLVDVILLTVHYSLYG
jgi:hypothetical protein